MPQIKFGVFGIDPFDLEQKIPQVLRLMINTNGELRFLLFQYLARAVQNRRLVPLDIRFNGCNFIIPADAV